MAQDTRTTPANRDMNNSPAAQPSRARDGATRPATPAAKAPSNRYLPNTGDVHETPPVRPAANKDRNNAGWSGNAQSRQPAFKQQQNRTGWSDKASGRRNDFGSMRHNMQATKRFNGGTYRSPQGYKYRHWSYGERLPRGYYVRNYWISDFVMFGLFAPPSELVWVRVGDDALLIDRESGDIVQVRYGVFY
jgi:Ni/Co efflux regulator RcnB